MYLYRVRTPKQFTTVGDWINRIIDLEDALEDMINLIHELSGPDSEKYEVIQRAHRILKEGIK